MALLSSLWVVQWDDERVIQLHQDLFLRFYVLDLLLFYDVDFLHNFEGEHLTTVLQSDQFYTAKRTIAQGGYYLEEVDMNFVLTIAHNVIITKGQNYGNFTLSNNRVSQSEVLSTNSHELFLYD